MLQDRLADAELELRGIDMNELADAVHEARLKLFGGYDLGEAIPDDPAGVTLARPEGEMAVCTGAVAHDEFTYCPVHDASR